MNCTCKRINAMLEKVKNLENENRLLRKSLKLSQETFSLNLIKFSNSTSITNELLHLKQIEKEVIIFMYTIKEGKLEFDILKDHLRHKIAPGDLRKLYDNIFDKRKYVRNKSLAIIYSLCGIHSDIIANFLFLYKRTIRKNFAKFQKLGTDNFLTSGKKYIKVENIPEIQNTVFSVLHSPPITHGINRTTWTVKLITEVVNRNGYGIGKNTVEKIIKNAGYRFRKARQVLTSNDPQYNEKLNNIKNILKRLGENDRFFSIDEFGPFSVKKQGGRKYVNADVYPTIPQWQKAKGILILIGALELSTNQITYFYSIKKDSEEMIKLLDILLEEYSGCRRIYLSWDAASWHSSNSLINRINEVNKYKYRKKHTNPIVKIAPLPARSQFLNVIESVFSGMSYSIIQNSDYISVNHAKTAIDRYFIERNEHYKNFPKRAGSKLWENERVYPQFKESQNCKNPRWR
jgi:hypothetical protein